MTTDEKCEDDDMDNVELEEATMTCNQAMVLLDIYRGTFRPDRHMGTMEQDLSRLSHSGLIATIHGRERVCTDAGTKLVGRILKMQAE